MKKFFSFLLGGAIAMSMAVGIPAALNASAEQVPFDENNLVLAFGSLSDPHIGFGTNDKNLDNALKQLKKYSKRPLDALYFHGDQTQGHQSGSGNDEPARENQRNEMRQFVDVLSANYDLTKTAAVITNGNHDTCWDGLGPADFYEVYNAHSNGAVYSFDTENSRPRDGDRDVLVGGYHFLTVEIESYAGRNAVGPISKETESWLKETLDRLTKENPSQYVFVSAHAVIPDSVGGSSTENWEDSGSPKEWGDWGGTKELANFFTQNPYPQVVLFSGHTHYNLNEDNAIMQMMNMTLIQGGSTSDACSERGYENSFGGGDRSEGQGMLVEADGNGNLRITRYDFKRGKQIKKPWYLAAPKSDLSHLTPYTREARSASVPTFTDADKALFSVKEISSGTIEIVYPLGHDDDMVSSHTITVKGGNGVTLASKRVLTPWLQYPDASEMPSSYKLTFTKLSYSYPFSVEIVANDSFHGKSAPLSVEIRDMTEEYRALAAQIDGRISALNADSLKKEDGEEIAAIREEISGMSYKGQAMITKLDEFRLIESTYNNLFRLSADAEKHAPSAADMYSIASTAKKGNFSDSAFTGVTLKWESAAKNNSLGFNRSFSLDRLHLSFANLNFTSDARRIALVLSDQPKEKWLEGESFLLYIDFGTGELFFNRDLLLGKSELLLSDRLGVSPFEFLFEVNENGNVGLSVRTLDLEETFTIPASAFEGLSKLQDLGKCYLSFTPWESRTTASLDIVAAHDGSEDCAVYPENNPKPTDPGTTDPGTTEPGTTDPGTTDPGTTDPGTTDPGTTEPEPNDGKEEKKGCFGVLGGSGLLVACGIAAAAAVLVKRKKR